MGTQCSGSCFSAYILLSLLTHVAELGFNSYLAYTLWFVEDARVWFSVIAGLLIIPLVTVQLVSAILYLHRQGDSVTSWRLVFVALLHIVQVGFYWRHIAILKEHFLIMKKKSLSELFILRVLYTLTSGMPLLLIQTYLFLVESPVPRSLVLYISMGTTLFSSAWSIASYRRQYTSCESEQLVLTWPGTLFRILWRIGELGARFISLALFASLYHHWIFLVVSFHWITMCLCVCTSVMAGVSGTRCFRVLKGMITAFVYTFCFININRNNSAFRYALFYVIMFFENATLCAVWVFMVPDVQSGYRYLLIFITASSFFVCVVAMSVYYKFFHIHSSHFQEDAKHGMCDSEDCINCKLSLCAKHNKELQRPFNTGWLNHYDPKISDEQFYKYLLQDSGAESSVPGDRNSTISTALSNPNFNIKNLDALSEDERRSVISFISSGTYVHRRYMEQQNQFHCDSWSEYSSDSHSVSPDRFSITGSESDSVSQSWENQVPALLTDNWAGVPEDRQITGRSPLKRALCNSLLREDSHNWYSDNASTDQPLEWSRLPVTKLARRKYKASTGSDTDPCPARHAALTTKVTAQNPDKLPVNVENTNECSQRDKKHAVSSKKSDHVNRLTGRKNKLIRNVNYVNDDNVYMEMRSPIKKLSSVYENVAFTDDILTQPERVFNVTKESGVHSKAPWYACSESGDSALPTETFSSSNCGLTDVDNVSHSSIEFTI